MTVCAYVCLQYRYIHSVVKWLALIVSSGKYKDKFGFISVCML